MGAPKPDSFYNKNISQWQENRDCILGQRAIHAGGRKYLPAPDGMDDCKNGKDTEYNNFKKKTLFLNATARTTEGMTGLIFRKKPIYTVNKSLSQDSVDSDGSSLTNFIEDCAQNIIATSRIGVLVEHPNSPAGMTASQAEALGIKPHLVMYRAEEIIRTRSQVINGVKVYTQVVIMIKSIEPSATNEFEDKAVTKYFVLDLHQENEQTPIAYRQRVLNEDGEAVSSVYPMMNGNRMQFIPFEIIETSKDGKAMIEDLVKANLNHYAMNASYTHGIYYTGFPTPWATGVSEDEVEGISGIGPNSFWTAANESASFGMLEFTGQGLQGAKDYLEMIVEIMAVLGADMLKTQKMAAETEGSKRLDKQASDSTLLGLIYELERGFEKILGWYSEWSRLPSEGIEVDINKDFNSTTVSPQMLKELVAALMQGAISYDTFWMNLQKGEVAKASKTAEDEQSEIDVE